MYYDTTLVSAVLISYCYRPRPFFSAETMGGFGFGEYFGPEDVAGFATDRTDTGVTTVQSFERKQMMGLGMVWALRIS